MSAREQKNTDKVSTSATHYVVERGLTVGNAVLECAEHERDDREPQSHDLSRRVACRGAEDEGHADHGVCGDGAEEDLTPV
jgi:hypothetical protein